MQQNLLKLPLWTFLLALLVATQSMAAEGDILFVTQPPLPSDFATINAVFANHSASMDVAPRGGDLFIRYSDGSLKNLTKAAGLGEEGMQGSRAIAVRDPAPHWDGTKVLFSMVVGAPVKQYEVKSYRWQLYEMTGLGKLDTPVVVKVPNQPAEYNNVMAVYGSDDAIIFASDRPRDGKAHLYPQLDEYESTPTNTGLWKLVPGTGSLALLDHAPSGDFHPVIDSFGRVVFSRWDHLQRDQQRDAGTFGTFDYSGEELGSVPTTNQLEVFPEPRSLKDSDKKPYEELHTINQFFPWAMHQDGTDLETINHVGRQEFAEYGGQSRNDDRNLTYISSGGVRPAADLFLHLREDPTTPGRFFCIKAPEFGTHASGQIISFDAAPSVNAAEMTIREITHSDTASPAQQPRATHSGLYRTPLKLSNGTLIASHTASTQEDRNEGTSAAPSSRHAYRLTAVVKSGDYSVPGEKLTPGIKKTISFWQPDYVISYTDQELWELQPVELVKRPRPPLTTLPVPDVEQGILRDMGVELTRLQEYLAARDLALIVSRDVTSRDAADRQQPFNLRVAGTGKSTVGAGGKVYDVSELQIFQGDLLRGIGGTSSPRAGRRVLARPLHDLPASNAPVAGTAPASVRVGSDGSLAAFVPARRALSWQLLSPEREAVVRERYWVTFQPGEVRVCGSCHGVNRFDQAGHEAPRNPPEALKTLLAEFSGDPIENPVPPEVSPTFSVEVSGPGKGQKGIPRGGPFLISVAGTNITTGKVTIKATVGVCSKTRELILQGGQGTVRGKIPGGGRGQMIEVQVLQDGRVVAQTSARIARQTRKSGGSCGSLLR